MGSSTAWSKDPTSRWRRLTLEADPLPVSTLRFVTFLAPSVFPLYSFIARHAGRLLGIRTTIDVGRHLAEIGRGDADVAFVCGLPYVLFRRRDPPPVEPLAAPVLTGERYRNRPIYFSDVIVRRGAGFSSFADLRGSSWAYNEPLSHSGYGVVRHRLVEMGETGGFFGRVVEAGFHQSSIDLVASGEVDASAIDSQVLEIELGRRPELGPALEVIDTLGPSTIQPVVASSSLPASLREDLSAVLDSLSSEPEAAPVFDAALVRRFEPIADADYDDIRAMLIAAEAAGFLEIR